MVGGCVVHVADWDDRSSDTILTRGYLQDEVGDPLPKSKPAAPGEVVLQWKITCQCET